MYFIIKTDYERYCIQMGEFRSNPYNELESINIFLKSQLIVSSDKHYNGCSETPRASVPEEHCKINYKINVQANSDLVESTSWVLKHRSAVAQMGQYSIGYRPQLISEVVL